jgi:hypothetical protein
MGTHSAHHDIRAVSHFRRVFTLRFLHWEPSITWWQCCLWELVLGSIAVFAHLSDPELIIRLISTRIHLLMLLVLLLHHVLLIMTYHPSHRRCRLYFLERSRYWIVAAVLCHCHMIKITLFRIILVTLVSWFRLSLLEDRPWWFIITYKIKVLLNVNVLLF